MKNIIKPGPTVSKKKPSEIKNIDASFDDT